MLQNENGPCPLLAAANALLLRGAISLPSVCIRNGCASLEEVVNMLAEKAMNYNYNHSDSSSDNTGNDASNTAADNNNTINNNNQQKNDLHASNSEQYVHEVLDVLPKLQYGMDVCIMHRAGSASWVVHGYQTHLG